MIDPSKQVYCSIHHGAPPFCLPRSVWAAYNFWAEQNGFPKLVEVLH